MRAAGDALLGLPVVWRRVDLGAMTFDCQALLVDVDDEFAEHCAEEVTADVVGNPVIEVARFGEQIDVCQDEFGSVVQTLFGVGEFLGDRALLQVDAVQAFTEFRRGDAGSAARVGDI